MYTKQEKLAAARKKLKEFQGRQRDNDGRIRNSTSPGSDFSLKDSLSRTPNQSPSCYSSESNSVENKNIRSYHPQNILENPQFIAEENPRYNSIIESDSGNGQNTILVASSGLRDNQGICENSGSYVISSEKSDLNKHVNDNVYKNSYSSNQNAFNTSSSNFANGLYSSEGMTHIKAQTSAMDENSNCDQIKPCTLFKDSESNIMERENKSNILQTSFTQLFESHPRDDLETMNQFEVHNIDKNVPSVSNLIDEENNLIQVLRRTEELLKYKTEQEQNLSQSVSFLQSRVLDLEENIVRAENEIQKLRLGNDQLAKQNDIDSKIMEDLRMQYDSKSEQFLELQQKFELKTKEYEYLNVQLQDTKMQLSSSLIKIQQLNTGESSILNLKVGELQSENSSLKSRIKGLEKDLEVISREKEESSHSFQIYAQQCNSQLSSVSSKLKILTKENRLLMEKNEMLEKNVKDLENQKNESVPVGDNPEIVDLRNKLGELTEENRNLLKELTEKTSDMEELRKEKKEKEEEINMIYNSFQEIKAENLKLIEEKEANNNNEKLLAAMESDKVAAARAVAQNQKLKEQVAELEEGFIKLSHEKLELTDELAHEKHIKKELELRLQELESDHCHDDHSNNSHDSTTNESADVEELKNIIRQLEQDKTELLHRLNSGGSSRSPKPEENPREHSFQDLDPESSKLLLQQMEEKVKKTMNEIAALDEEKEKLEHLVLQLQGETETIGEYISLYQTQRMLLRQRSKEKDQQLMQLAEDKKELKLKLSTLNELVNHLLSGKGIECKENIDITKPIDDNEPEEYSHETVAKIQSLISEIQSIKIVDNQTQAFEHCHCCSGRLITI